MAQTKLGVKLHDTDLLAMHTLHRRDRSGNKLVAAQYQVPTPVERRCQTICEIPEGSSLLISLGMRDAGAGRQTPPSPRARSCNWSACRRCLPGA